jgi:predicted methyltransferase
VLKPGGVLGVVQHRAAEGSDVDETARKGYVTTAWVVAQAEAAGFVLEASSEINANLRDTKDYEQGVWTLPPSLDADDGQEAKYKAIGESDRMTLRFVRPRAD